MPALSNLPGPPPLSELGNATLSLFLDFDGTLVDLAELPTAIVVPEGLDVRLEFLSKRLAGRLALVSGRSISDLERYLGKLGVACAGSHGLASRLADGSMLGQEPKPFPPAAARSLATFAAQNGFLLEEKPHSGALHYRSAPHLEAIGVEFAGQLAHHHGLQVKRGSFVIELVSKDANKGAAVQRFMGLELFAGSLPIFVGDDLTDEDGFAAASALGGFGVLVGERQSTAASYALANAAAVLNWLGL